MTRAEFVLRLVLDYICDDFENVDQILLREVAETGRKCGLAIQRSEVIEALRTLVADGLAKAYDISASSRDPFAGELEGMPPLDEVEEDFRAYFYRTRKGLDFLGADTAWWPFDDDGELQAGWRAPEP